MQVICFHLSPVYRVQEGRFHESLKLGLLIDYDSSIYMYVCKIRLGCNVLVSSIYQGLDGLNATYEY